MSGIPDLSALADEAIATIFGDKRIERSGPRTAVQGDSIGVVKVVG